MSRLDTIRDRMSVDQPQAAVVENDETSEGEWRVLVDGEWASTWTTRPEAEEHAKRINEALEWEGQKT